MVIGVVRVVGVGSGDSGGIHIFQVIFQLYHGNIYIQFPLSRPPHTCILLLVFPFHNLRLCNS